MTDQQKGVITLIKSALEGKAYTLPEGFDMAEAVKTALRHKITALVYHGAVNCGIDKRSASMQKLFPYLIATMNMVQKQQYICKKLCTALVNEGIDHMPMKGAVIQDLYPLPEMRSMGDLDILIRMEQYPRIVPIMNSLGFEFRYESDHELVWKRSGVDVELHKHVIPTYDSDYYAYFKEGWDAARQKSPYTYEMSAEDFYIYIFLHMTKHYRMAGIGIKHFVDLWVYTKAMPQLDMQKVDSAMEQLGLQEFYAHVRNTLDAWFADAPLTEQADYITQVVFDSAEYGLSDNREAAWLLLQAQKEGSVGAVKRRNNRRLIFPGLSEMKKHYKVLNKVPVLLPIFWVVRWFSIAFGRRDQWKVFRRSRKAQKSENLEKRRQALAFVGLEFKVEEK